MRHNPIREIAERTAQRYTGHAVPPTTARTMGAGTRAPGEGMPPLNDPVTGEQYLVWDVGEWDDDMWSELP